METLPSNEEFQCTELRRLFDEYQLQRGSIDWSNTDALDLYERIWTDTGLYDEALLEQTPAATITIPLDIQNEPLQGTLHTLHTIHNAASNTGPLEIMLWANYRHTSDFGESAETYERRMSERHTLNTAKVEALIEQIKLQGFDTNRIRIRVALDFINEDATMNDVRSNCMEAVAYDAVKRGLGANHKIIWFDDDMTYIHHDALAELYIMLDSGCYKFVKANMLFTSELNDLPLTERSELAKAAAIYAIARRMGERTLSPDALRSYLDECGLAMTLGTYLEIGGLLENGWQYNNSESDMLLLNAYRTYREDGIASMYHSLRTGNLIGYAQKARIGTSNRKLRSSFQYGNGLMTVQGLQQSNYETYVQATHIKDLNPMPSIKYVPEATIWKMLGDISIIQEIPNITPDHHIPSGPDLQATAMARIEAYGKYGRITPEALETIRRNHRILALLVARCNFTYVQYEDARHANSILGADY